MIFFLMASIFYPNDYSTNEEYNFFVYPLKDINEKIFYIAFLKFRVENNKNYLISFIPELMRESKFNEIKEVVLNERFIFLKERREREWYPLISGKKLSFKGIGNLNYVIFDLKIESPFLMPPGNYYLKLKIDMENAKLEKNSLEEIPKPLVLKKNYFEFGKNEIKVNMIIENISEKELKNLKIYEFFKGEGKIKKFLDFLPQKFEDKSFELILEKLTGKEKREFNYIVWLSEIKEVFSTITEVEGYCEGSPFHLKFNFPYFLYVSKFNGRGGVMGEVFFDENGDGIRQENEKGLKNVKILISNGREVETDENGKFSFSGLLPDFYSIYYFLNGKIFYFNSFHLSSFETKNLKIPIRESLTEDFHTSFLLSQFKLFLNRDGIFSKSFHLFLNDYFNASFNSNERNIKSFCYEMLFQFYSFPVYGDNSQEFEDSKLKRKFSLFYSSEKNGISLSYGFLRGFFQNSYFLKYNYTSEGMRFSYGKDKFLFEIYAQRILGKNVKEILIPDDTLGPFYLKHKPIIYSSEQIILEVRDKNLIERVISQKVLQRNIDYYIDYTSGILNFYYPIPQKSLEGNPLFLQVAYQIEAGNMKTKDISYGFDFSYLNNGIRFLQIQSEPENKNFFEIYGNFLNFEYSIGFEKYEDLKKALRFDYRGENYKFYYQEIEKGFENPSNLPLGDGIREIGGYFERDGKKFGLSLSENYKGFLYSNLYLEYIFKDFKVQNSLQYLEERKKILFGSSLIKQNWELHFSKSFYEYFLSFFYKKKDYNLNLKIENFKEYLSFKLGAKRKNFDFNFCKDFKSKGANYYEISYKIEGNVNSFIQSSIRYDRREDFLNLFFYGRNFNNFLKHFYYFLDGRLFYSTKGERNAYINGIFGFRPSFDFNSSFFIYGYFLKENEKENKDFVFGYEKKSGNFGLNFQGKKENKLSYYNFELEYNFYKNFSIYFNGNYLKEIDKERNSGIGFSVLMEDGKKFQIGYNFEKFPQIFYQDKWKIKKGFYFGISIPYLFKREYKIEEEKVLKYLKIEGENLINLGENLSLKIFTLDKDKNVFPFKGTIEIRGINENGSRFLKKINFTKKEGGIKLLSLNFSKKEDEGTWFLYFYDFRKREIAKFSFFVKRKDLEMLSFEPPEIYSMEKREEILIPKRFKVNAPEKIKMNSEFEISIEVVSEEEKICKNYTGEVFIFLSDGNKLKDTPVIFTKYDYGIKRIKLKIEKEGDFFIIVQDKNKLSLMGISNLLEVKDD